MLSSLVKDHATRSAARRQQQERRRKEATEAAEALTHALVDHLNVGVAQAYLNQKRLDAEAKELHTHAAEFARQTQQWLALVDSFQGTLKEIGDVESWSKAVEGDLKTVSTALEYTYKVNREARQEQTTSSAAPQQ